MYVIDSASGGPLPAELTNADEDSVEATVRAAAAHLGWPEVEVERVTSAIGCMATIDVVAYAGGTPVVVARPALFR